MKKLYITVKLSRGQKELCTKDLIKMHHRPIKKTPRLPAYDDIKELALSSA